MTAHGANRTGYLIQHPVALSLDELLALNDIGAVEIYYDWAPAQFGGGVAVVLWTGRW